MKFLGPVALAKGRHFDSSWRHLGDILAHLGVILAHLGLSWLILASSWLLAHLGVSWQILASPWRHLGSPCRHLGVQRALGGVMFEPYVDPKNRSADKHKSDFFLAQDFTYIFTFFLRAKYHKT